MLYKRGLNEHIVQQLGVLPDSRTWKLVDWQRNAINLQLNKRAWYRQREYWPMIHKGHAPMYHPIQEFMGDPMDVDAQKIR